jgi:hypothetical protein
MVCGRRLSSGRFKLDRDTQAISFPFLQMPARRRALELVVVGAASLLLGGCLENIGSLAGFGCKRVKSTKLKVTTDATCKFRYGSGDFAKYVVVVTRQPTYGEAYGEGKYLKYVAKPGFVGEDHLNICGERRGIGHVQWQNHSIAVRVGTNT